MTQGSPGIVAALRERYLDVVASIYIYNEHRGYTSLDRVLDAARRHCPDDPGFIAQITKHRADERKHYLMFRRWFERRGRLPIAVNESFGHIDRFIRFAFGRGIDDLDVDTVVADVQAFEKLCRVIAMTEQRGLVQVEQLLGNRTVMADPIMARIFRIIHDDEPSHFLPYRHWLERRNRPVETRQERFADWCIHKLLLLVKLPGLFLHIGAPRMRQWPDAEEAAGQDIPAHP